METEIRNTVLETNWREVCPVREKIFILSQIL